MLLILPDISTDINLSVSSSGTSRSRRGACLGAPAGAPASLGKIRPVKRNEEHGTRLQDIHALSADRPTVV